jgi:hypothetical protein
MSHSKLQTPPQQPASAYLRRTQDEDDEDYLAYYTEGGGGASEQLTGGTAAHNGMTEEGGSERVDSGSERAEGGSERAEGGSERAEGGSERADSDISERADSDISEHGAPVEYSSMSDDDVDVDEKQQHKEDATAAASSQRPARRVNFQLGCTRRERQDAAALMKRQDSSPRPSTAVPAGAAADPPVCAFFSRVAASCYFDEEDARMLAAEKAQAQLCAPQPGKGRAQALAHLHGVIKARETLISEAVNDGLLSPDSAVFLFLVKKQAKLVDLLAGLDSRCDPAQPARPAHDA